MNGWLIYNAGLHKKEYLEVYELYKIAGKEQGIIIQLVKNNELFTILSTNSAKINREKPDFVIFLDKDIRLARELELLGIKIYNSAKAIEICDDKIYTTQILSQHKINIPKSIFNHLSFFKDGEINYEFTQFIVKNLGFPLVLKEAFGSLGKNVYLVENREKLVEMQKKYIATPHIYQEFIKSSKGRDIRIYVVGEKVVGAMYRENLNDFRSNVSNGGRCENIIAPSEFCEIAVKVAQILELDFCGIDVMFGENDEPIICEVNSNAHIKNFYDASGINVAESIIKHIMEMENIEKRHFDI